MEFALCNLMDSYGFENRFWPISADGNAGWLLYGGTQDTVHRPTFGTTGFYFEREPWYFADPYNFLSGGMVKCVGLGNSEVYGDFSYGLGYRGAVLGKKSGTFAGDYNAVYSDNSVALGGEGLISLSSTPYQAVVGKYNNPNNNALFVVGAGGSDTNRVNVLEVNNNNLTLFGNISTNGTVNVASISSRFLDLVHLPANDGVNPVLRIGEYDTTSGNQGFSGMYISYNESSNVFGISAQFAPSAGVPAVSIDRNGNVGINTAAPSEKLTVSGNISANGNLTVAGNVFGGTNINLLTSTTYTIQLSDNGGTIASSNSTAGLTAVPSTGITYPVGFQTSILQLSTARVALSSNTAGITINQANAYIKTTKQYSAATLLYTGTLAGWVLFGDVGA
jgi:hypothetical protein